MMTVGYREGQFLRQEISPEELRQSAETINGTIEALARDCEILPTAAPRSPSQLETLFLEVARPGSLDPMYLAAAEDLLLLSDDLHYRNLAAQLYHRNGVWLQVVLMAALEEQIVDFATYSHAVGALSVQRHNYVTVSADVLVHIVQNDDSDHLPRMAAALEFIGTPTAEISSHLRVAWDFMLHVWNHRALSDLRKAKACGMVLTRLLPMFSPHGDSAEILRQMIRNAGHRPELQRYVHTWAQGHFIVLDKRSAANSVVPPKRTSTKAAPKKGKKKPRRGRLRR
jgi:hypothetical protein